VAKFGLQFFFLPRHGFVSCPPDFSKHHPLQNCQAAAVAHQAKAAESAIADGEEYQHGSFYQLHRWRSP
jgi:hypothetical protein